MWQLFILLFEKSININILQFLPYKLTHPITQQKQRNQFSHVEPMAKG